MGCSHQTWAEGTTFEKKSVECISLGGWDAITTLLRAHVISMGCDHQIQAVGAHLEEQRLWQLCSRYLEPVAFFFGTQTKVELVLFIGSINFFKQQNKKRNFYDDSK